MSAAKRRLKEELKELAKDPVMGCTVRPESRNELQWTATAAKATAAKATAAKATAAKATVAKATAAKATAAKATVAKATAAKATVAKATVAKATVAKATAAKATVAKATAAKATAAKATAARTRQICTDILHPDKWSPNLSISKVLLYILSMLCEPIPDNAVMADIGRVYRENREQFKQTAREWTRNHAV